MKRQPVYLLFCLLPLLFAADNNDHAYRFLHNAVKNGLQHDAFPRQLAGQIAMQASQRYFVAKCPVCRVVSAGFTEYSRDTLALAACRLPQETLADLQSAHDTTRFIAFSKLINSYLTNAYIVANLPPDQEKAIRNTLENGRKQGMAFIADNFGADFCPSCDGATCRPKN